MWVMLSVLYRFGNRLSKAAGDSRTPGTQASMAPGFEFIFPTQLAGGGTAPPPSKLASMLCTWPCTGT
ncbi:hypothetical protein EV701_11447 [Chthoniobacter flavus]|nr:hypothetical protein EV701_11447 [Chthoniobacter flavus]